MLERECLRVGFGPAGSGSGLGRRWAVSALLAGLLAACSSASAPTGDGASSSVVTVTLPPVVTSAAGDESASPSAGSTSVPGGTPFAGDVDARVEQFFRSYRFPPDGPHPFSGIVHFEFAQECLNDLGWFPTLVTSPAAPPTFLGPTGLPPDLAARYREAVDACLGAAADGGAVVRVDGSPEFRARLYRALLEVRDCMVEHGFAVAPPPSEQAFIAGEEYDVYSETPVGGLLAAPPVSGEPVSERDRRQYEIQETCPAWFGALDLR